MNAHVSVDYINDMIRLVCLSVCLCLNWRFVSSGLAAFPFLPFLLVCIYAYHFVCMSCHITFVWLSCPGISFIHISIYVSMYVCVYGHGSN